MTSNTLTGFKRPTFQEILDQRRAAYQTGVPGGDVLLEQGVLPRLPEIDAESQHALHGHLDWAARQAMPLFADGDNLDFWGAVWGVVRKAATTAAGTATFTGLDGTEVLAGTELMRGDEVLYTVSASGIVAGGVLTLAVEAQEAGLLGNSVEGVALALTSPVAGITEDAVVAAGGLVGGTDAEIDGRPGTTEAYRGRILGRIQKPPHGGAAHDYEAWALEVAGVTRVWVRQDLGVGTVTVRFMMDDTYANGIPLGAGAPNYTGDLATVKDYIESHVDPETGAVVARPVTADVFVVAPIPLPLNVEITGLSPDTPETRAEIEAEIADMLRRRAEPEKTIKFSWISEAVSVAAGEDLHDITAPVGDVVPGVGEIVVMGAVTYVGP